MGHGTIFKDAEHDWRQHVPTDQWVIVRLDGRAFHTYCRPLDRPYDTGMLDAMNQTAAAVAEEAGQRTFAYTQSDEISLCMPPLDPPSQRLFGGRVDKLCSLLASLASVVFNDVFDHPHGQRATFDARVFTLAGRDIVDEYLRWRLADARRNAISMVAEHHLTRSQLHGTPTRRRLELLADLGVHIDDVDDGFRHGRRAIRTPYRTDVTYMRDGQEHVAHDVVRHEWIIEPATDDPARWDVDPAAPAAAA